MRQLSRQNFSRERKSDNSILPEKIQFDTIHTEKRYLEYKVTTQGQEETIMIVDKIQ